MKGALNAKKRICTQKKVQVKKGLGTLLDRTPSFEPRRIETPAAVGKVAVGNRVAADYSARMTRDPKRLAIVAAKFALPAIILAYLLGWRIDADDWQALADQEKRFSLLWTALIVAIGALSISFARWCLLVRAQGIELSMLEAFRLGSICFLLSFVSAGSVGGDLFKAVFLARRRPGKRIEAVASVLVDRGSGLYGLLLLVAMTIVFTGTGTVSATPTGGTAGIDAVAESGGAGSPDLGSLRIAVAVLVGLGTAVLATLVLGGRSVDRMVRWSGTLPWVGGIMERIGKPLRMFHERPVAFAVAVLMSVAVQAMLAVSIYLVARGLYESPPTLAEHFVIVPIAMLASALPISPAGLGVLEAAMESLYHLIPAEPTVASGTLVALVFELVKLTMAAIGTLFYWTAKGEVRESLELADQGVSGPTDPPTPTHRRSSATPP